MKKSHILLLGLAMLSIEATAQNQYNNYGRQYRYDRMQYQSSVLSIFSETGEPFYLILNGIKQNLTPQNKIRVEALPKYQNDVQIVFADNRTPPIRKVINIADPIDGRAANLYLRISRDRGMARLRFHRLTECDRNYQGPRDEYVMNYGKPQQINTVTETTYMDPVTGQWITETTSTTSNNYNGYNNYNNQSYSQYPQNGYSNNTRTYDPAPPITQVPSCMDGRSFSDAKQSISSASFEDTKLSTAKTILNNNWMSTDQIMEICQLFSFENTKVTFAKYAYSRTTDPQNYYKVASVFDFDSNKKALNDFINTGR